MSDTRIDYKDCTIEVETYQSDGGRWRARAIVSQGGGAGANTRTVPDLDPTTRATEGEARDRAVALAKMWIDNFDDSGPANLGLISG